MEEEIKTKVPIELIGEAVGVKEHEGIMVHGLREVEVKCLPGEIPGKFEVDVSSMKINDALHISDLKAPKGVEILSSLEETVVYISPPTKEEELAPVEEVPAAEVPSEMGAAPEEVPAASEKAAEKKAVEKKAEAALPAEKKAAAPAEKKASSPEKK